MFIECFVVIVFILILVVYYVNSPLNYINARACDTCEDFKVNRSLGNYKNAAHKMQEIKSRIYKLVAYMERKYGHSPGIENIKKRFSSDRFYENSPFNVLGSTSFTDNKDTLYMCLRNRNGTLYDMSTLMFVVLHELSHMMLDSWGHGSDFWQTFRFLLRNAHDAGLYTPIDYSQHNINYCGLELTNNPYY